MAYTIYIHTFPNGKVYVGCTQQSLSVRYGYMGDGYKHQERMFAAIQEFGWNNIKHEVLETTEDRNRASELEQQYIDKYKSTDPEFGYNTRKGGLGAPMGRISEEICAKITKGKSGAVGIHKDGKNKYVRPEEVQGYLQDGWLLGGEPLPEAQRQHLSEMYQGVKPPDKFFENSRKAVTGSILMHKGDVNKRVRPEEYEMYLADGWIKGMSEEWARIHKESHKGQPLTPEQRAKQSEALKGKNKGKKYINKDGVVKFVHPEEIADYLAEGWKLGSLPFNKRVNAPQSKYKNVLSDCINQKLVNNHEHT